MKTITTTLIAGCAVAILLSVSQIQNGPIEERLYEYELYEQMSKTAKSKEIAVSAKSNSDQSTKVTKSRLEIKATISFQDSNE